MHETTEFVVLQTDTRRPDATPWFAKQLTSNKFGHNVLQAANGSSITVAPSAISS